MSNCELCGEPMPAGEEMFMYHGHSGNCPKPPLPRAVKPTYDELETALTAARAEAEALRATIGDSLEVMDSMIRAMYGNADCEVVVSMMKGYAERANKRVANALPPVGQNKKVCEKTHISDAAKEE